MAGATTTLADSPDILRPNRSALMDPDKNHGRIPDQASLNLCHRSTLSEDSMRALYHPCGKSTIDVQKGVCVGKGTVSGVGGARAGLLRQLCDLEQFARRGCIAAGFVIYDTPYTNTGDAVRFPEPIR